MKAGTCAGEDEVAHAGEARHREWVRAPCHRLPGRQKAAQRFEQKTSNSCKGKCALACNCVDVIRRDHDM